MTQEEAILVLAVLRAAYPTDFPYNMSVEDAEVTATVWCEQFQNIPGVIVEIAVKKLIATEVKPFPPAKVKKKIGSLYWEAKEILDENERNVKRGLCSPMDKQQRSFYEYIKKVTENYKYREGALEPSISRLVEGKKEILMLGSGENGNL